MLRLYYFHIGLLISTMFCFGQDTLSGKKAPIRIGKVNGKITLDGLSNEEAWNSATSMPFMVLDPIWNQAPTEKTELFITYDDNYLYAAGRCYTHDSTTIIARNLIRDGWRGDDWMTLHIDSRFDKQNALVFSVYPLGSRYDMATSNDAVSLGNATFNEAVNLIWDAKTVINKDGWFFEMKIPLYNLRFKIMNNGEIQMGISSTRSIQAKQEFHQFPAVAQNAVDPVMKPSLKQSVILTDISKPRLFLVTPYILSSRNRANIEQDNHFEAKKDYKTTIGFDAKIGLSSYLTLDVTANPDFSQVEADNQMVNLTRFSLFFPERRLFFQEQAGLFEFNLGGSSQLFYSRRIGINAEQLTGIYGGLRLTGKIDSKTDIGFLSMQTAGITLEDGSKQPTENFGVLRLRRKVINDRSFIGVMATNRNSREHQNYAVGTDALLNPVGIHYIFLGAASTFNKVNDGNTTSGINASRFSLLWETRRTDRLFHKLGYSYSGKNFDPAIGFVDRGNYHNYNGSISIGKFAKTKKGLFQYKKMTILDFDTYQNAESKIWETLQANTSLQLKTFNGSQWTADCIYNYEFLADNLNFGNGVIINSGKYNFLIFRASYSPPQFHTIRFPIQVSEGSFFDGRRFNFNFSPLFNLGKHWEIKSQYDYTYLRFSEQNLFKHIHIARLQVNYFLDLHLSVNLISQYNSTLKQFFNNLRLRYNFRDGHDLFLVWNENFYETTLLNQDRRRPASGNQALILKYSITFDKI